MINNSASFAAIGYMVLVNEVQIMSPMKSFPFLFTRTKSLQKGPCLFPSSFLPGLWLWLGTPHLVILEGQKCKGKGLHTQDHRQIRRGEKDLGCLMILQVNNISERFIEQAAKWYPSTFTLKQFGDLGVGNREERTTSHKLGFLFGWLSYLV